MKIKKFLLSIILIFVSIISISGCAKVEVIRTVDSYYAIMDKLVVTLDEKKLGNNYSTVKENVNADMITFRNYVNSWIKSFELDYPKVYLELQKGIVCEIPEGNNNELSILLSFSDISCFSIFYGLKTIDDVEYTSAMEDKGPFLANILNKEYKTEEFGLFLYKYSMINNGGILDIIEDYEIKNIDVNYYEKYRQMTGYSLSDLELTQIFTYPDDRIYSNADTKEVLNGVTFLAWDLSDKGKDFEMSIYKIAPQTITWYVLALVISAVFIVIAIIFISIKYRKEVKVYITKQDVEKNE